MATHKKLECKTPGGGSYLDACFFDDNGNVVDEDVATRVIAHECADGGAALQPVHGITEMGARLLAGARE